MVYCYFIIKIFNFYNYRINTTCADIGYSPKEICDLKKSGRTIQHITTEIFASGHKEWKDGKYVIVKTT